MSSFQLHWSVLRKRRCSHKTPFSLSKMVQEFKIGSTRLRGYEAPRGAQRPKGTTIRSVGLSRGHCILGEDFKKLTPPFRMHLIRYIFFLHYTKDITLTFLRNSLFLNNKQNIFFHCYKKHLRWGGDKLIKKVSPIVQCSMTQP